MEQLSDPAIRVAVIGAGVRGTNLARRLRESVINSVVVAVAEPDAARRDAFAGEFGLKGDALYQGWEELTAKQGGCDAVIIATLDNQHAGPAIASLGRGWHVLLEKPLADTLDDCRLIAAMQETSKRIVAVCHTLRFMEGFRKVRQIVAAGDIGAIIHVEHMEAIGHLRYVHNYVRGRWAREKDNTFLLLHKCSHDIDYISWLFSDPCIRVSSFGSLRYFKASNAPAGSTRRCTGGCRLLDSCPYSALRLYAGKDLDQWPARDICGIHTREAHLKELETGPYGSCVWHAGNDVVDHQTVMMEFAGGATATCTLTGYSATNGRRVRVQGTHGELLFDEASGTISLKLFTGQTEEIIRIELPGSYHPEDREIVDEWLTSILHSTSVTVDAREALRTHAVVFAAETSRKEKRVVEMEELLGSL